MAYLSNEFKDLYKGETKGLMKKYSKIFVANRTEGKRLTQPGLICHMVISPEMGSKNLMVGYLTLAPKGKTKPNIHPNSEEAFYITKGSGVIKVDGEIKEVKEGDLIFIPENTWHEFENTGDETMEWVLMLSPPPSAKEYQKSPWEIKG